MRKSDITSPERFEGEVELDQLCALLSLTILRDKKKL